MPSQNPYESPQVDESYVDPLLHRPFTLDFELTQADVDTGIKKYLFNYPPLILFAFVCFLASAGAIFLMEEYGLEAVLPHPLVGSVLMLGFIVAVYYLASRYVRAAVLGNIKTNPSLGEGRKTVCLRETFIDVRFQGLTQSYELREANLLAAEAHQHLILEIQQHTILIVPPRAFFSKAQFVDFKKSLKKRLRRNTSFWSTRSLR